MEFISVFDVMGPNMVGPSSSHTAGSVSIALLARKMIEGELKKAEFTLYGSFAKTYKGHGTDHALLGGILGFSTDDLRIRDSYTLAKEAGIDFRFIVNETEVEVHPNTVDIYLVNHEDISLDIRGESVGGGKVRIIRINGVDVDFTGEYSTLIIIHRDRPGVVAYTTKCLSDWNVNIAFMKLYREDKGATAYSIVESDEKIPLAVIEEIRKSENVDQTMLVQI